MKTRDLLWHYTTGHSINSIIKDGLIRPATAFVSIEEKPIVWFSTEQYWEPTVTKGFRGADGTVKVLGMTGLLDHGIQLIRIGVEATVAPYNWQELKLLAGMSTEKGHGLAAVSRRAGGNPSRWRGSFDAVISEKWSTVECFTGGEWVTQ